MKLFDYLEKHGELENATATLEYFADTRPRGGLRHVDVDSDIFKCYRIVINNTTTRYGQYHPTKMQIELHEGLLVEGREKEHRQTLLHEVAHLIHRHIWDGYGKAHGREWKMVMFKLGIPANRCHSSDWMAEHKVNKAKLIYACRKCEFEIPAQKTRKLVGKTHRNCGGGFYLKEDRRNNRVKAYVQETAPVQIVSKPVLGTVFIKKALYRNRRVKPGTYQIVRDFKFKKNENYRGTISILIGTTVYRITVNNSTNWFVRT